jgi:uncharacterized PurR-regulated membrane protein YhhQ (DUF165 family)
LEKNLLAIIFGALLIKKIVFVAFGLKIIFNATTTIWYHSKEQKLLHTKDGFFQKKISLNLS